MVLRRETYWFSDVFLTLTRYRSQTSDNLLFSKIQKVPTVLSTGGRTTIPSGRIRQKLSFTTVSLGIPSLILLSSTDVRGWTISRTRVAFHIVSCVRFRYCISSMSDVISSHIVWRHFSSVTHKNFHSGTDRRSNFPWISLQHWWWSSMCTDDKGSQVCWIWPKVHECVYISYESRHVSGQFTEGNPFTVTRPWTILSIYPTFLVLT
jgi:hypothetical protein